MGTVVEVISELAMRPEGRIMIVGHEPLLSELVETLCAERPRGLIELKKAGCACLRVELDAAGPIRRIAPVARHAQDARRARRRAVRAAAANT